MPESGRKRVSKWDVSEDPPVSFENELKNPLPEKIEDVYNETHSHPNCSSLTVDYKKNSVPQGLQIDDSVEKEHSKLPGYAMKDEIKSSSDISCKRQSPKSSDMDRNASISLEPSADEATRKYSQVNRVTDKSLNKDRNLDNILESRSQHGHGRNIPPQGWSSPNRSYSRSRSRSRSMSRGRSRSRSWSRGRSRSRSRSWNRGRSRSRSWSRGRSRSPIGAKYRPDRWVDRQRTGPGQAPICRDFTTGRCRRGSECRFRHDDRGHQEYDRHNDKHSRERGFERDRYQGYGYKEKLITHGNHNELSHKPLRRHGAEYDDEDLKRSDIHRNNKSTEICFDFTKGRCQRGSTCKYVHDEESYGIWSKEDGREIIHDKGDVAQDILEPRRVSDTPCIYFAEGRCRRGQSCKFSHHETPFVVRPPDDQWSYNEGINDGSTGNATREDGQRNPVSAVTKFVVGNELTTSVSTGKADSCIQSPQVPLPEIADKTEYHSVSQGDPQKFLNSGVQDISQVPPGSSYCSASSVQQIHGSGKKSMHGGETLIIDSSGNQSDKNSSSFMPSLNPVPVQGFAQNGQSQFPVPPLHGPISGPNVQVPPGPFRGQMPQMVYPMAPAGLDQFMGPLASSNMRPFIPNMPMPPFLPPVGSIGKNLQNSTVGLQIQQNAPFPPNELGHQNLSVSGLNPSGHNQFHVNLGGQSSLNVAPGGQNQRNLSQNSQSHVGGQNQHVLGNPPVGLQGLKSEVNLKSSELAAGEGSQKEVNVLEVKPTSATSTSDSIISNKVVTSEQKAKITDLSASLAQFFGSTGLHSSSSAFPPQQALINPSSAVLPVPAIAPSILHVAVPSSLLPVSDPRVRVSQPAYKNLNPLNDKEPTFDEFKNENIVNKQDTDSPTKKVGATESGGKIKKEEKLPSDDDDDERADGDAKRNKDAKAIKMFKCALVDFVKNILKPIWKEGQLSKEAHKIIVKKVVDKVSSALSASNIPSTPEKIDSYLLHSKAKLGKLVQAYVEKYVKN